MGSGVTYAFGGRGLAVNNAPPRIVWVPSSDEIAPPSHRVEPPHRSVRTRQGGIEAHVWGISYDQTEAMVHNLISAVATKFSATAGIGTVRWGEAVNEQDAFLGWLAIVPIYFSIPVLDAQITLPTTLDGQATQPEGDAEVTIVAGTPAENEVNAVRGTTEFDHDPTD